MRLLHIWILIAISACQSKVSVVDGEIREGQECFVVSTPTATYYYQKEAGGFSNILDANGTDWIQFHKTDTAGYPHSAASDYRGLPNLVFQSADGGCGHPGFDKMNSKQISANQIRSTSKSKKWQWLWTFYPNYAELTIEKTDPEHAYWFLYEGPIAGKFSPKTHYWGVDASGPMDIQPDLVNRKELTNTWQTIYFGDRNYDKTFFVRHQTTDKLTDMYAYMGNTQAGNDSRDGMVVFGYGRDKGAKPLMNKLNTFIMGFFDQKIDNEEDHQAIIDYVYQLGNE